MGFESSHMANIILPSLMVVLAALKILHTKHKCKINITRLYIQARLYFIIMQVDLVLEYAI